MQHTSLLSSVVPLLWRQADHDVFVAYRDGAYAGHVTADHGEYTVFDDVGRRRGVAATAAQPRLVLADAHASEHERESTASHVPRRPRRAVPSRIRGPRPRKKPRMTLGTVKWFDVEKGYGFIAPEDGSPDLFAHFTAIDGDGFRSLEGAQRVEFDAQHGPKGPQASRIRVL